MDLIDSIRSSLLSPGGEIDGPLSEAISRAAGPLAFSVDVSLDDDPFASGSLSPDEDVPLTRDQAHRLNAALEIASDRAYERAKATIVEELTVGAAAWYAAEGLPFWNPDAAA